MIRKIVETESCFGRKITVDDVDISDFSIDQIKEIAYDIVNKCITSNDSSSVLSALLDKFGDYECDNEPCEQCGSFYSETTLVI